MRITTELLRQKRACPSQVEIFENEWADGAEVTLENCLRGMELGLDFEWAAYKLLSTPEWRAYRKAEATVWKAYRKVDATEGNYLKAAATAFYEVVKEMEKK